MTIGTIRAAIVAKISGVAGAGTVQAWERYANDLAALKGFYTQGGRIHGWLVTRTSTREMPDTSGSRRAVHRWSIRGYRSLVDAEASELEFSDLVERVRAAFRWDETLGDVVETTIVGDTAGLQLDDFGPVMFGGLLCHGARLSLETQEIVTPPDGDLDDFITANIRWDLAPPDGAVDAEDTVTLEAP